MRVVVLRFVLIAAVAGALSYFAFEPLCHALVPPFRLELAALDDHYRIERFTCEADGIERVFAVEVGLARTIELAGHRFQPDPRARARASTLAAHPVVAMVLVLSAAFAVPARDRIARRRRLLAVVPALILIWAADVPMLLWANLWSLHLDAFAPDRFSPLVAWAQFMEGGGRLVLAVLLGGGIGMIGADTSDGPQVARRPADT